MKRYLFLIFFFIIISVTYELCGEMEYNWAGEWYGTYSNQFSSTNLTISDVTQTTFTFYLLAMSGSHFGEIQGSAIITENKAIYRDTQGCEINFILIENKKIRIDFTQGCMRDAGYNVFFDTEYSRVPQKRSMDLIELYILTEQEDRIFRNLVKNDYELFTNSMQITVEDPDLDNFNARVISGGVTGLYTINEAIIMITADKKIWCAVIADAAVKYYTNVAEYKVKLPKTIDAWRSRFREKQIIFMSK